MISNDKSTKLQTFKNGTLVYTEQREYGEKTLWKQTTDIILFDKVTLKSTHLKNIGLFLMNP